MLTQSALAKGTFGIVEGRLGATLEDFDEAGPDPSFGFSAGLTVKQPGFPFRLYIVGSFDSTYRSTFRSDRSDLDFAGEARLVLPLSNVFRIYGLLGGGARYTEQTLYPDGAWVQSRGWTPLGLTGGGIQIRPHRNFSFGARAVYTWTDPSNDLGHELFGESTDRWTGSGFFGIHF